MDGNPETGGESTSTGRQDDSGLVGRPAAEDASGFGLSMTLVTGVLLALAYYGLRSVTEFGVGRWIPEPFYMLAYALLFVIELARSDSYAAGDLARAVAATLVYGTLVVLAVEGGAYLWEYPETALEEYRGVAVLAVSFVVAALAYVLYLSVDSARTR